MKPAKPKRRPTVRNPIYKGATPEQVGRALLRHKPKANGGSRRKPKRAR